VHPLISSNKILEKVKEVVAGKSVEQVLKEAEQEETPSSS
jgi:hypothetical protein